MRIILEAEEEENRLIIARAIAQAEELRRRKTAAEEEQMRKTALRNCQRLLFGDPPWRLNTAASSSTGQPDQPDFYMVHTPQYPEAPWNQMTAASSSTDRSAERLPVPAGPEPELSAQPVPADRVLMAPAVDAPAADPPPDPPQVDCQGPPFVSTLKIKNIRKRARSRSISGTQNSMMPYRISQERVHEYIPSSLNLKHVLHKSEMPGPSQA